MKIRREETFDAGHRLVDHGGQCQNLHGHTYRVAVTLNGPTTDLAGNPENGMVLDFAWLKSVLRAWCESMDHAFLADPRDKKVIDLVLHSGWRLVVCPGPPTAENLARWCAEHFALRLAELPNAGGLVAVVRVEVWETPKNCAVWEGML
jgi:6-pyruvoyltetrahydropterin/6-carboxytetrahydropterin synthase